MASEITVSTKVAVLNGGIKGEQSVSLRADQTTAGVLTRTQTIPTSDTVITLTGITAPRWVSIKNKDDTNYVKIGPTSGGAIVNMIRLKPGEVWCGPIEPSTVLRAQANTASVVIEVLLVET